MLPHGQSWGAGVEPDQITGTNPPDWSKWHNNDALFSKANDFSFKN
jgi:hypothetical protein